MDFFQSQEQATRSTRWLLGFFLLALLGIVLVTNGLLYLLVKFHTLGIFQYSQETFFEVSGVVLIVVVLGSLYRVYSLKQGGVVIAEQLGGRLLLNGGETLQEQRLGNVVEEMAIASGTPVPPVYIFESDGINAFAAGYTLGDAVIGVTRGAIMNLNRDQLQGVIAHEFSHILNGDMKLNIRLVGVLHGILMLSVIGRLMLETRGGRARKSSATAVILILGLGLFLLGYIGKFFGDLIKAAVSRQREFFADASAVEYTRNPEGIAGALKRIGGYTSGSRINLSGADEFSHLYFSEGGRINSWLATHPALSERIQRLDPNWDGQFMKAIPAGVNEVDELTGVSGFAASVSGDTASDAIEAIGNPGSGHLQLAKRLLKDIPSALKQASYDAFSARALVYLLLLSGDSSVKDAQLAALHGNTDVFVRARLRQLLEEFDNLNPEMRLPLLELSLPILRQLTEAEYHRFKDNVQNLVTLDQKVSLTEWSLQKFLLRHLGQARRAQPKLRYLGLEQLKQPSAVLLSTLAYGGNHDIEAVNQVFFVARKQLELNIELIPKSSLSLRKLDGAIDHLVDLHPLRKPRLLKACASMILSDSKVTVVEAELFRTFSDLLDCPMPPISMNAAQAELR